MEAFMAAYFLVSPCTLVFLTRKKKASAGKFTNVLPLEQSLHCSTNSQAGLKLLYGGLTSLFWPLEGPTAAPPVFSMPDIHSSLASVCACIRAGACQSMGFAF